MLSSGDDPRPTSPALPQRGPPSRQRREYPRVGSTDFGSAESTVAGERGLRLKPKDVEMPKDKDLKKLTRKRMQKTGEAYTTARAQLLKKKASPTTKSESPPPDLAKIAGISEDSVRKRTGRSWEEWLRVLDHAKASTMTHKEIAAFVADRFEVSAWWAQSVTIGYERIRGLREVGQQRDGDFSANKSKTYPVSVSTLYRAFSTARQRDRWLPKGQLTVTTSSLNKSVRIRMADGTALDCYFTEKGPAKSQVALQHRKLKSKSEVEEKKTYWTERLAALGEALG